MSDLVGNPEDRFSRVAAQFIASIAPTNVTKCKLEMHKMSDLIKDRGAVNSVFICFKIVIYESQLESRFFLSRLFLNIISYQVQCI